MNDHIKMSNWESLYKQNIQIILNPYFLEFHSAFIAVAELADLHILSLFSFTQPDKHQAGGEKRLGTIQNWMI